MNRRKTAAAVLVAAAAIVYGMSPIDIIPELLTGPFGLADDFAVFAGAGLTIWKLLSDRRQQQHQRSATPPPAT
jgi:uncharacterized membrane protein YkvA (DUF1232 family)